MVAQVDVQQVMTPGGSIREVLVRCSFDHLVGRSESLFREALPGKGTAWAAGCVFTPEHRYMKSRIYTAKQSIIQSIEQDPKRWMKP